MLLPDQLQNFQTKSDSTTITGTACDHNTRTQKSKETDRSIQPNPLILDDSGKQENNPPTHTQPLIWAPKNRKLVREYHTASKTKKACNKTWNSVP
ncbi:hypothetical protein BHE74_00031226 [Ensete ventricosum]|uniref:Uncharacterized protein n=1 Tax=Ensete ventricosum TaxID=4639 RepID=A0A427B349_ENSVE|nr:hypothetical protein B296_00007828 [Ensete ventricosum]RWW61702.1 hypothetical protein BHE74_00031226 [Ensete ventricosum]